MIASKLKKTYLNSLNHGKNIYLLSHLLIEKADINIVVLSVFYRVEQEWIFGSKLQYLIHGATLSLGLTIYVCNFTLSSLFCPPKIRVF